MEDITVSVTNFGPIEKGKVVIKPFTVFLGKNNTGKSYLAMLTHTFSESLLEFCLRYGIVPLGRLLPTARTFIERRFYDRTQRRQIDEWLDKKDAHRLRRELTNLVTLNMQNLRKESYQLPAKFSRKIHRFALRVFEVEFAKFFKQEIERMFGCKISELCCHSESFMKFSFELNNLRLDLECQGDQMRAKASVSFVRQIVFRSTRERGISFGPSVHRGKTVTIPLSKGLVETLSEELKDEDKVFPIIFFRSVMENVIEGFLSWEQHYSNYLPAARSGILAGHKALASGLLRQLRRIGLERMEFFPLSGIVTDFLASILQIQKLEGFFPELARFLEREVLEGRIDIKEIEKFAYPEIIYEFGKRELPLHRSSSMVSEVAPLVLYLKYLITPGSTIVIEEPESHLHPEAQRRIAQLLARLVNRNVRVILTSHSDYLLHQIQNLVLLSEVEDQRIRDLKYSKKDKLASGSVAVYLFKRTKPRLTRIKTIDIYDTTLKGSGFNEVIEELYGETVRITRSLKKSE